MNADNLEIWEGRVSKWSRELHYPTTPDIASAVARQLEGEVKSTWRLRPGLAWMLIALLLLGTLMAVPPVRAHILEFLQIGALRIFLTEPTPTATHEVVQPSPLVEEPARSIPTATPHYYPTLNDLAGETSLAEAQNQLDFPVRLPAYPPDLGEPDRIFLQDLGGQAVLLVWMEPGDPDQISLDLLLMGPGTFADKSLPPVIEETTVNGQRAVWAEGPHLLHLGGRMHEYVPLVSEGNILIWEQDGITYRLESDLPLEEAVKVAESLE